LRFAQTVNATRKAIPAACLLILASVCGSPGVIAQESGTIEGMVSDRSGRPVNGATVLAMNVRSGESWQTNTDTKGVFQFGRLRAGTYRVSVGQPGYEIFESDDLRIEAQKTTRLEVRLKPARSIRSQ